MRRWQRFLPHSYWLMASAAILLVIIGVRVVSFWQQGAVGDWAIFFYGMVTSPSSPSSSTPSLPIAATSCELPPSVP